jgi:hypothetical protein
MQKVTSEKAIEQVVVYRYRGEVANLYVLLVASVHSLFVLLTYR